MFPRFQRELTRRSPIHQAGFDLVTVSLAGAIAKIVSPTRTLAQAAPSATEEPAIAPDERLGWAVVGLGKFATNHILPSFAECKRSKLVALVSGDRAKADGIARQYGVNPKNIYNYQNYDDLRNNSEVDVIYIILPNRMHAEYTIRGA
jgi:Oxidoreductase family, NAD-binding Rossmann fold